MKLLKSFVYLIGLLSTIAFLRFLIFNTVEQVNFAELGKINLVANHQVNPDIAVFGSSVAWRGVNPVILEKITGKSAYNLGLDGNSMIQYNGVLKEFIEYSKSDYIIIVGTYDEFNYRSTFYEIANYVAHFDNENIRNGLKHIDKNYILKNEYIPFYDLITLDKLFYQYLFSQFLDIKFTRYNNNYADEIKGFLPVDSQFSSVPLDSTITASVDHNVLNIYRDVITEANTEGIKVILVLAPIFSDAQQNIHNLNKVRSHYKALAKGNVFVDLSSSDLCKNKEFFYDNLHVNKKGASIMSEILAEYIK